MSRQSIVAIENRKRLLPWSLYLAMVLVFMQNENSKKLMESFKLYDEEFSQKYFKKEWLRMATEKQIITIEEIHKELDLVQGCINRMAQNSFMIKGWGFTIVTALVALTAEKINWIIISGIGVFILLCFWCLDAFFLKTEKLYRFKYEWIIDERPKGNRKFLYDLNPYNKGTWKTSRKAPKIGQVMFSKPFTLLLFYGSPFIIGLVVIVLCVLGVIS